MPEYVALSTTSKEFGDDSSTDGEDGEDEGTLHLLFQNQPLNDEFSKKVRYNLTILRIFKTNVKIAP
jgi:hypothetical protein